MAYRIDFSLGLLKQLKKLKKHDPQLYSRLENKIQEIAENPEHYKPPGNALKGKRRAHIGSL